MSRGVVAVVRASRPFVIPDLLSHKGPLGGPFNFDRVRRVVAVVGDDGFMMDGPRARTGSAVAAEPRNSGPRTKY